MPARLHAQRYGRVDLLAAVSLDGGEERQEGAEGESRYPTAQACSSARGTIKRLGGRDWNQAGN
jgi:hypothetical protein